MIDRKLILYVLLGITVFAMWDAWQKDYPNVVKRESIDTEQNSSIVSNPSPHPPSMLEKSKMTSGIAVKDQIKQKIDVTSRKMVRIKTDVLDVAIDTVGGNINRVSLLQYPEVIYQKQPVKLLSDQADRYYVAQSGLVGELGPDYPDKQAEYTVSQREYRLLDGRDTLEVDLLWKGKDGVKITKSFVFKRGHYDVAVRYKIDNKSSRDWLGQFYAQIKRRDFDNEKKWFQFSTYTGASTSSMETPYEKIEFSDMEKATKARKEFIRDNEGGWIAMQQRYFLSAWVPAADRVYRYFKSAAQGVYTIGLSNNNAIEVASGDKATVESVLYVGPEIAENLTPLAKGLERTVDYGWLWFISLGLFWVLKNIYRLVGNWGVAIVLVTILIKLIFYKLSESSCRSMARMRDLMPKMQTLKERYGDDKQKLHQATMELYKRENINPLNFGGCLPMLIQIPFFIALYYVLVGAVELRHAPFIFWIRDLSAADPFYVLPILMGASMVLQQRLTPSSADPAQAKMMMFMPVVFTVFFLNFPSGLVLYWLVNNLLSILQQWHINRKLAVAGKSKGS